MGRVKGQTNSKPCMICNKRTIYRHGRYYDYTQEIGAKSYIGGSHTCTIDPTTAPRTYKLGQLVESTTPQSAPAPFVPHRPETHYCPICAADMVIRTAKRGYNSGKQFWGCSQYKAGCRGTRQVEGQPAPASEGTGWSNPVNMDDEPTIEPTIVEPEPTAPTTPAPTTEPTPGLDFNAILNGLVQNTIAQQVAQEISGKIDGLEDTVKAIATQVARDLTPRVHNISVTVGTAAAKTMTGRPHMKFERLLKSIARRKHVWICGQAGSGKTTAAQMIAEALDLPYQEISLGPATSQWDLFGFPSPDGKYVEPATSIRKVFEFGGILMLDECDNADASVLKAMNSALANGLATFPDARVAKHPDFVCIAGANTFGMGWNRIYVGSNQLDAATLDRFKFIPFDVDEEAELDWAGHDQKVWVEFVQKVRHAASERELRVVISPRASINGADELRDGDDFDLIADEYIWNKMSVEDSNMLKAAIN